MATSSLRLLRGRLLRPIAALSATLWLLESCYSWGAQQGTARQIITDHRAAPLRLIRVGGARQEVSHAELIKDTVFGYDLRARQDVRIPLDSVTGVEVSQIDGLKTAAFVGAMGVAVILVINGTKSNPPPPPPPSGGGGVCNPPCTFSCPLVYAWDGTAWRLDSGTFGGAIAAAFQRTDVDNLIYATPQNGRLRLRVANELDETDHIDALSVVAVDHDSGASVAPDASGRLHTLRNAAVPVAAVDDLGRDVLWRVRDVDDRAWESALIPRDTSRERELRDGIVVSFVRPQGATRAHLVVDGNATVWAADVLGQFVAAHGTATRAWYDSLSADPALAATTGMKIAREGFLSALLWDGARWSPRGLIWDAGPEISKQQVLELDLRALPGDTVRVRLESVPAFWRLDRVAMDFSDDVPAHEQVLALRSARDRNGHDVAPLLSAADHSYYTLETGDAADLVFDAPAPPAAGTARSFILRSTGWYRIRTDESLRPDTALLRSVLNQPLGVSRAAVARLNARLAELAGGQR
jgi:hypothetical protein